MSDENNLHAAMERAMQSGDMGIRPMAKEDDGPIGKQVLIRTTDSDRAMWKEAASTEGVTLSSWIRTNLNNAAKNTSRVRTPCKYDQILPMGHYLYQVWQETR